MFDRQWRHPHPRLLTLCASGLALVCFGQGLWIHAQMEVAQVSIETAREGMPARPDLQVKGTALQYDF